MTKVAANAWLIKRARQARVFCCCHRCHHMSLTVLGELSEDVFEDRHESHGDVNNPNRTISEIIDFRVKSLRIG